MKERREKGRYKKKQKKEETLSAGTSKVGGEGDVPLVMRFDPVKEANLAT